LGPNAKTVAREIFERYYPIEQSGTLTVEQKLPFMIEWWAKTHELMIEYGVTKSKITKAVEDSDITLREGFMEIFDLLAREKVPTLIFSAGLYDVIHAVLSKEYAKTPAKAPPPNVHVISNMMHFGDDGKVVGFDGAVRRVAQSPGVYFTYMVVVVSAAAYPQLEQERKCTGRDGLLEAVPA
jgi:HAD superfamily hydrolase (TIGR01544 family)